ncbi:MAG TPA: thioredoxin family protein [Thermoanaerobaculia bacterium]|nr:thioredoxin family protein [Thermoanaerobaculia bacterium]
MVRTSQRYVPIALFILAALLLGARVLHQTTKSDAPAKSSLVRWHTPKEGLRLAAATGRPLLFDFTADWCGPCHMLDGEVFQDPAIARAINERFIPVRVVDRQREEGSNPPEVAELQRTYNVRGFPTVVFAASAGAERQRMEGFRGRAEFERIMERAR